MPDRSKIESIHEVKHHLAHFSDWINAACTRHDLPIHIDVSRVVQSLDTMGPMSLPSTLYAYRTHGVQKSQVETAVEVIAQTIAKPRSSGLIVDAGEIGTIGVSLLSIFVGPISFLLSGIRYAPVLVVANRKSCLESARNALHAFLNLYGDLEISSTVSSSGTSTGNDGSMEEFSLAVYLDGLLDSDRYRSGSYIGEIVDAAVLKRLPGSITANLEAVQARAAGRDQDIFAILDHTLFSPPATNATSTTSKPSVVARTFAELDEDFLSSSTPGMAIAVSPGPQPKASARVWRIET